jgi:hypothetical protein
MQASSSVSHRVHELRIQLLLSHKKNTLIAGKKKNELRIKLTQQLHHRSICRELAEFAMMPGSGVTAVPRPATPVLRRSARLASIRARMHPIASASATSTQEPSMQDKPAASAPQISEEAYTAILAIISSNGASNGDGLCKCGWCTTCYEQSQQEAQEVPETASP